MPRRGDHGALRVEGLAVRDEPILQGRGIDNVTSASAFRDSFRRDHGVTMADGKFAGLLARAVVVVGADGTVATPNWCRDRLRAGLRRRTGRRRLTIPARPLFCGGPGRPASVAPVSNLAYDDLGSGDRWCSSPAPVVPGAPGTSTRCRFPGCRLPLHHLRQPRCRRHRENADGFTAAEQMVADTVRIIEKLTDGPVRLVAMSMGAFIARG